MRGLCICVPCLLRQVGGAECEGSYLPRTLRLLQHELQLADRSGLCGKPEVLTVCQRYCTVTSATCPDSETCVLEFSGVGRVPLVLYMKSPVCAVNTLDMMLKRSHEIEASRRKTTMLTSLLMADIQNLSNSESPSAAVVSKPPRMTEVVPQVNDDASVSSED